MVTGYEAGMYRDISMIRDALGRIAESLASLATAAEGCDAELTAITQLLLDRSGQQGEQMLMAALVARLPVMPTSDDVTEAVSALAMAQDAVEQWTVNQETVRQIMKGRETQETKETHEES